MSEKCVHVYCTYTSQHKVVISLQTYWIDKFPPDSSGEMQSPWANIIPLFARTRLGKYFPCRTVFPPQPGNNLY